MSSLFRKNTILRLFCLKYARISNVLKPSKLNVANNKHFSNPCSYRTLTSIAPKFDSTESQEPKYDDVVFSSVDDAISEIDREAKHMRRIRSDRVKAVFELIKANGKVSSIQSLYLIRSCGALMRDELPSERIALVNEMWDEFQKLNVPMDASHYNSLLKAYIENEHNFVPTDFLSGMEKKGISPNRVTYQRLVDKYCEDGDLVAATAILDFMKQKSMPINETVFNSLIKCHAKAGDFKDAREIMTVMERSNLKPNLDTYMILANSYAQKGDIESVSSVIEEAKTQNLYFSTANFLDLIYTLVVHGQGHHVDWMLERMPNVTHFRTEFINAMFRLLNKGFDDGALKLLLFAASKIDITNGFHLFLKHIVQIGKPVDVVIKYCVQIQDITNNKYMLQNVTRFALEHMETNDVVKIFREMLKQGLPVRCHFFWPILAKHNNMNDTEGILQTLKIMYDFGICLDYDSYLDFVLPSFINHEAEHVIKLLKETGHSDFSMIEPLFTAYCNSHDFENAKNVFQNYQDHIDVNQVVKILALNYSPKEDHKFYNEILKIMSKDTLSDFGENPDLCGLFLVHLLNLGKLSESVLKGLIDCGFEISRPHADYLCSKLRGLQPELLPMIRNLQFSNSFPMKQKTEFVPMERVHARDMSLSELESHLEELRQSGGSTRLVLRNLLNHYCKNRNITKVLEIEKELDEIGFLFSPAIYAVMIEAFISINNIEETSRVKQRLDSEFPDFKLDILKIIDYATLLIRCDRLAEAEELIKQEIANTIISVQQDAKERRLEKLFNVIADTGNVKFLREIQETIASQLEINLTKLAFLRPLIKVHLKNNDLDKAIDEYKRCVSSYRIFPCLTVLMKTCVLKNEYEKLQNVLDISTSYGDSNSRIGILHELAMIFIETRQFQQACKIFQDLGGRVNLKYLDDMCARLYQNNMLVELEDLLAATKGIYHIDRDHMYFYLLKMYAQNNSYEKALELWHTLQEENVQPSIKTLRVLADLLENNDQPIPFVVPVKPEEEASVFQPIDVASYDPIPDIMECLKTENVDKLSEVLKEMKKGHIRSLPLDVVTKIIECFAINDKLQEVTKNVQLMSYALEKSSRVLRPLFEKFGENGDIILTKKMFKFVPDFTIRTLNINYNLYKAFFVNEKYEELLSEIEGNLSKYFPLFSFRGFMELLEAAPHLEERVVNLANVYAEQQDFHLPKKMLWAHYFIQGKEDKADEIFKKNFALFTAFDSLAKLVIRSIQRNGSLDLGKRFIKFINNIDVKQVVKDRAYASILDVLMKQNAFEDAVELLKESKEQRVSPNSFSRDTLIQLQDSLKQKGQTLPIVIPLTGDSSSSSESD